MVKMEDAKPEVQLPTIQIPRAAILVFSKIDLLICASFCGSIGSDYRRYLSLDENSYKSEVISFCRDFL
ncbi:hypothetical protein ACFX2G_036338 [Malus domestica]